MNHLLLKKFPEHVKPSYETVIHKKVSSTQYQLALAIPYGRRAFLWFTVYETQPICCIVEWGRNQKVQDNIQVLPLSFPKTFAYGTLLSGYYLEGDDAHPDQKYFLADEIFMLKGYEFGNPFPIPMGKKLQAFMDFFRELPENQCGEYSIHSLVMWPYVNGEHFLPEKWQGAVGYNIKCLQLRSMTEVIPYGNTQMSRNNNPVLFEEEETKPKNSIWSKQMSSVPMYTLNMQSPLYKGKRLFWVQAELEYDVYVLYVQKFQKYQYACVPDMKTSKMLNAIFRNIPENDCLDKIEESDDEEMFENIDEDKYIQGKQKRVLMECFFHRKFKKWVPLGIKPVHLGKFVPYLNDMVVLPQHRHHKKK